MLMNIRNLKLPLCLLVTVIAVPVTLAVTRMEPPTQSGPPGTLTVVGMVKVNGQPAATGDVVSSGSTVETAAKSSAVVSLGKLGRVEALPESSMKLSFDNSSITVALLSAGRVRVSSSSGTAATVDTTNGKIVATGGQENKFTVDTSCGNTFVATEQGMVEVQGRVVTRVPAGSDAEIGTPQAGCRRN